MRSVVTIAAEGTTDVAVAKRLLAEVGLQAGPEYIKSGKAALGRHLGGYNSAARFSCWLVLRDLDHDAACAPELRAALLPAPSRLMRLHIAVRAIEAWLLADTEAFGTFFSVAESRIPPNPESLDDPKEALVNLVRRSRRRAVREAIVPPIDTSARIGPGYVPTLAAFVRQQWRPEVAARRSRSLDRLRKFLEEAARRNPRS